MIDSTTIARVVEKNLNCQRCLIILFSCDTYRAFALGRALPRSLLIGCFFICFSTSPRIVLSIQRSRAGIRDIFHIYIHEDFIQDLLRFCNVFSQNTRKLLDRSQNGSLCSKAEHTPVHSFNGIQNGSQSQMRIWTRHKAVVGRCQFCLKPGIIHNCSCDRRVNCIGE